MHAALPHCRDSVFVGHEVQLLLVNQYRRDPGRYSLWSSVGAVGATPSI